MVQAISRVVWRVVPARAPHLIRRCRTCDRSTAFYSTDKFRINANKRCVEVWLIYRCAQCETNWKRPLFERQPIRHFAAELLERLHRNDVETARGFAHDCRGVELDRAVEFSVDRPALPASAVAAIDMPRPVHVRWDRLLAQALGISRRRVRELANDGRIVRIASRNALNARVRHGDLVKFDLARCVI